MNDVYESVEATLLDSEGEPTEEVEAALEAVAAFVHEELEMSLGDFLSLATEAWRVTQS
jgi:hypothetical protein